MSSEDVIELGSSDEETEPAPKRHKKPVPNAMVCFPREFQNVTIKPLKPNPAVIARGLGKAITVKKVVNNKPPVSPRPKLINGRPVQQPKSKFGVNPCSPHSDRAKAIFIQNKPNFPKVPLTIKPRTIVERQPAVLTKPIKIKNSGPLNLPPSITVKKAGPSRPVVVFNVKTKQQINQSGNGIGNISTVELDDDETPVKSSPQWYVRPEDQLENSVLEEENNKEPDESKLIEITIEDSPVKPILNKQTHMVGAELSITIDDSPVKAIEVKNKSGSESDNECDSSNRKFPHSKKQLIYPKETDDNKTVEIEIEPHEISLNKFSDLKKKDEDTVVSLIDDDRHVSNEIVKDERTEKSVKSKCDATSEEFHPVYQSFIDLCFRLENSDDMKTIVEKKIKGYYKQVPKEYTESEEFIDMVSSKILSMKAGPEKMYLYIKDVVDELNLQRKLAKAQPVVKDTKNEEPVQVYEEDSEYDSKRRRQIRKLEKTIKKLHRAIQKLEEQEVDFDDEDDSVYLLTERYKERMVRVYAKFCQLSNTKMPSEPRIQIDARPGRPTGPAKRIEKWINKKVPIGTPLPFPDFHDVLRCVREANEEDRLNFNEADIMEEARDLFTRCGKKLQRRRQENEWRLAASRIALDIDPAENSDELKQKLNNNRKVAAQKETDIFNKYADRQNQLKLEAEEIGDKEAEESPVESEEEEANEDSASLENAEQRKERLKRLLHEKSKKTFEEKVIIPSNEDQNNENDKISEATTEVDTTSKVEPENTEPERMDVESIKENVEDSNKEDTTTLKEDIISQKGDNTSQKEDTTFQKEDNIPDKEDATTGKASVTLTLSDDSDNLESDIDELHLLQKLHSANEDESSTVDSSDSESPIAISDSLDSSDDSKKGIDVISIENSSYSENEGDKDSQASNPGSVQYINEDSSPSQDATATLIEENAMEVDLNRVVEEEPVKAPVQTNNDEYTEAVENILLASSEEDSQLDSPNVPCVNLRDDLISIDETVIGNITNEIEMETESVPKTSVDTEGDKTTSAINIDINVMSATYTEIQESIESEMESQADTVKNTDDNILDEIEKQLGENMDTDQDDSIIKESEILGTPDMNVPGTSLKES